eukprot:TRINITY_DN9375_c0_g1_i14.p1 TRINITY_DN9375_c0_g1~~TRINITY_DN9375_c0_g1_i14.p1  ORF type:complete len:116 (-),score=20.61 TRINITY_DN9375_c0_g1_i14:86-433(-)
MEYLPKKSFRYLALNDYWSKVITVDGNTDTLNYRFVIFDKSKQTVVDDNKSRNIYSLRIDIDKFKAEYKNENLKAFFDEYGTYIKEDIFPLVGTMKKSSSKRVSFEDLCSPKQET